MPDADLSPDRVSGRTAGYFGKMPAAGDFLSWNLPRIFVDRWDRWMSMELRDRPDQGLLYLRAWRFIIPGGIFGEKPCIGAWRMSEDRFGRRYPLAIVAIGHTPETSDPWFEAVVDLLEGCVIGYWDQSRLRDRLTALAPPETTNTQPRILFWCEDWEVVEHNFSDIHDLAANGLPAMRTRRESETL